MPVGFLPQKTRTTLNTFPETVEEGDLAAYFLLTPDDLIQIRQGQSDTHRLGFAVLLCALRYLGFFPADIHDVPARIVTYLAEQIGCDPTALADYGRLPKLGVNINVGQWRICDFGR